MVASPILRFLRRRGLPLVIAGWALLACGGMKLLLDYQSRPGAPAVAPALWPPDSRIVYTPGAPRLVLFVHPHCPCTRASLGELELLLARTDGRLRATIEFVVPPGERPEWGRTELWRAAHTIPGVQVALDADGVEARRFGAATSGQTLMYDGAGRLRFAGGITPGRGHAGDNAGSDAMLALVSHGSAPRTTTPVYGCALASPTTPRMDPRCPK